MATRSDSEVTMVEISVEGELDIEAAERASVAVIRPNGTLPPLILVRSWSRELESLSNLARFLGDDQPLYLIGPPRFDNQDEYPETVEEWARFCLPSFEAIDCDEPFFLGGWSFGGVIALQIGDMLAEQGRDVRLVAMVDSRLPKSRPKDERSFSHKVIHHLNHAMDMESEYRLGYLRERAKWQLKRLLTWAQGPFTPADSAGEPDPRPRKDLLTRAIWVSYLKYQPQVSNIPIALFSCKPTIDHVCDQTLGWSPYLRAGIESVVVPGEHMTMFEDSHVEELATRITQTLERVRVGR